MSARRAWRAPRCRRPSAALTWPVKMASGKFHGADAQEDTATGKPDHVAFAGRAGQHVVAGKIEPGPLGVVAAEVDGFAHLGDAVDQCLAGFARGNRHRLGHVGFHQVGRAFKAGRPLVGRASPPKPGPPCERSPTPPRYRPRRHRSRCRQRRRRSAGSVITRSVPDDTRPATIGAALNGSAAVRAISRARVISTSRSARSMPLAFLRSGPKRSSGNTIDGWARGVAWRT